MNAKFQSHCVYLFGPRAKSTSACGSDHCTSHTMYSHPIFLGVSPYRRHHGGLVFLQHCCPACLVAPVVFRNLTRLKAYPYPFHLRMSYRMTGPASLEMRFSTTNIGA
ncbi:hypothetical protein B6259_01460 [Ruminococcaceae bacterium CPB6]|nr:hypothetical protein B6259_01460 [Ruminococcaceae bacterium CPB6]